MAKSPVLFEYFPNYAVPPGETLVEVLEDRELSQADLARCTGLTLDHVDQIIDGRAPVSTDVADRLERVTDVPARLWLNLEANYRERLVRLDESVLRPDLALLEELPISSMVTLGLLTKRLGEFDRLREVLVYLGVANRQEWLDRLVSLEASFRMSKAHRSDRAAVAVWLRMGEIASGEIDCAPWNPGRFRSVLRQVRSLTREPDPAVWHPRLVELCAGAGVALVVEPEVKGARTHGAARWLTPGRALIQLSIRGRWSDMFWFSFFHEARHILDETKQPIYLSGEDNDSPEERKADRFAQNSLIPEDRATELHQLRYSSDVRTFAASIGIHPGIVVGRLHYEGLWEHAWGNDLRQRLSLVSKEPDEV